MAIALGRIVVVAQRASPRTWRHNCAMAINGKTQGLRTQPPRWVLHNYYMFESVITMV